jgi:hypothetical protein
MNHHEVSKHKSLLGLRHELNKKLKNVATTQSKLSLQMGPACWLKRLGLGLGSAIRPFMGGEGVHDLRDTANENWNEMSDVLFPLSLFVVAGHNICHASVFRTPTICACTGVQDC